MEVTIPSSELSIFVIYPKKKQLGFLLLHTGTMLGSENSELSSFALY